MTQPTVYDHMRLTAQTVIEMQDVLHSILAGDKPYADVKNQYAAWAGAMSILATMTARHLLDLLDDGRPF